jgi:hypothetical protein
MARESGFQHLGVLRSFRCFHNLAFDAEKYVHGDPYSGDPQDIRMDDLPIRILRDNDYMEPDRGIELRQCHVLITCELRSTLLLD